MSSVRVNASMLRIADANSHQQDKGNVGISCPPRQIQIGFRGILIPVTGCPKNEPISEEKNYTVGKIKLGALTLTQKINDALTAVK